MGHVKNKNQSRCRDWNVGIRKLLSICISEFPNPFELAIHYTHIYEGDFLLITNNILELEAESSRILHYPLYHSSTSQ